jgi:plastocyanin
MKSPPNRASAIGMLVGGAVALVFLAGCSAPGASSTASAAAPSSTGAPSSPSPAAASATAAPSLAPSAELLASTTESATEAPTGSVEVEMFGPPPQFREQSYSAAAGKVVFFLRNTSPNVSHGMHALAIGPELHSAVAVSDDIRGGSSAVFTVEGLEAGAYVIWCPLRDHAELGMVSALTVQ